MGLLTESAAWKALERNHRTVADLHMRRLFADDPGRFHRFSLSLGDLLLDYSKNRITSETMSLLAGLAREAGVEDWRDRMFSGEKINSTEGRSVLHVALRHPAGTWTGDDGIGGRVRSALAQMEVFSSSLRAGTWKGYTGKPIADVVCLGIGGSELGPAMVVEALAPYAHADVGVHFVSNVDGVHMSSALDGLAAETTLFIVTSKSFGTIETMTNAASAKSWIAGAMGEEAVGGHFAAVTANTEAARSFGIGADNVFPMWDWVGGRYSLWSAVGLPIAIAAGMERFKQLLAGAHAMDQHFREAPLEANMPVILGLLGVWYINFFDSPHHGALPYDQGLKRLPAFLQQLDMESNGKRVSRDGTPVDTATGPVIFGEPGTNAQHSFFQLLHQGTPLIPADFIAPAISHCRQGSHHSILLANFFAQTEALMNGRTECEARDQLKSAGLSGNSLEKRLPHMVFQGNRPTNSILVRKLDPHTLGMLIALYEHKIFVQGLIWRINSFDQWGVELGKQLATALLYEIMDDGAVGKHDSSTQGLIDHYRRLKANTP